MLALHIALGVFLIVWVIGGGIFLAVKLRKPSKRNGYRKSKYWDEE